MGKKAIFAYVPFLSNVNHLKEIKHILISDLFLFPAAYEVRKKSLIFKWSVKNNILGKFFNIHKMFLVA